jgi:hypothetical protein
VIAISSELAIGIAGIRKNSEIFMFGGDSLRKPKNPNPPAE